MGGIHHEYGPSGLRRIQLCPGSVGMCRQVPDKGDEAAQEGELLHAHLPENVSLDDLDGEQREAVLKAREYIKHRLVHADPILFERTMPLWDPSDLNEVSDPLSFGTVDVIGFHGKDVSHPEVIIIDLKFGRLPLWRDTVELQMRAYAAMALGCFQSSGVQFAEVFVFAPRTGEEYFAAYRDQRKIFKEILQIILFVEERPNELRPSAEACVHCRGRVICPAFSEQVLSILPARIEDTQLLAPEKLAQALELSRLVVPWAEQVRRVAIDSMRAGVDVPGWKIHEKAIRKIREAVEFKEKLNEAFRESGSAFVIPDLCYLRTCTPKLADVERLFVDVFAEATGKTKKESKEIFTEIFKREQAAGGKVCGIQTQIEVRKDEP